MSFVIFYKVTKKFVSLQTFATKFLMKKILITGASGFIGSFIVEEALRRGMETWAVVRRTSSREYLQDERIHFIELDFSSVDKLKEQLSGHQFDYVVHAAGVTKCLNKEDFFRVNRDGTRNFVQALQKLNQPLERFVFLSSLSIFGAIREQQPYKEIEPTDTPHPNTAYGKSKLEAEQLLPSSFPYVILRPTGVYGPREKDYFLMAKSIKGHSDFAVGYKQQDITFVYVKDVVQATFLALDHGKTGSAYFLSDGKVYQSTTFSDLIHEELGRPWWVRITAPIWVLRVVTFFGDLIAQMTGKISALNNDKYQILKQRNWRCNVRPAIEELGYKPEYDLKRGVKETIEWYKKEGWL
ncbi:Nucleoside-diphosphate-sugar epimerase [Prevotella scopos JCM 17725]|uniref:Nucleoside-diphosphate-sugar epimerase n=2 Tax=Prevotella TaxID=838 RepID=A0AAX2F3D3_9BACT|nr:Nucleoside-diphosphate-sugar epimerase [Prevotella scopos JCM 17725]